MSTLNPAMARAFALLRDELYEYLDASEMLTEVDEDWHASEVDSARGAPHFRTPTSWNYRPSPGAR